jgi:hypothetical protein
MGSAESVFKTLSSIPNPFKGVGLSNLASKATSGAKALASGATSVLTSKKAGNFAKGALGLNRRGTTTVITGRDSTTVIRTKSGPSSASSALGRLAGNIFFRSSPPKKRQVTIGGNKKKPSKKETILSKKETTSPKKEKKSSKKETNPPKKEKTLSKKETNPPKKEKKSSKK